MSFSGGLAFAFANQVDENRKPLVTEETGEEKKIAYPKQPIAQGHSSSLNRF